MKTTASQLKAKMGRFMRAVKTGKVVVITDRGEPVARLVPYEERPQGAHLEISQARDPTQPALGALEVHGINYDGTSTTALLREDRDAR